LLAHVDQITTSSSLAAVVVTDGAWGVVDAAVAPALTSIGLLGLTPLYVAMMPVKPPRLVEAVHV